MKLTGKALADFVLKKIGTPYVYGAKGADGKLTLAKLNQLRRDYPSTVTASYYNKAKKYIGKVCTDCSGLISWYTGKVYGSAQLYSIAKTKTKINKNDLSKIPVGAVVWKPGHVGVYIGNGEVVEAMGIDYGTVKTKLKNRTFTHYLTFDFMEYSTTKAVTPANTKKCPYNEPTKKLMYGDQTQGVKWVQWYLQKAGYNVTIDGIYGADTLKFVKKFKKSCKITPVNGLITDDTIKALKAA